MIDGKTCLLEKESDPTQLRSPSPGKLVSLLLENGDHIKSGEAYAEIEVSNATRFTKSDSHAVFFFFFFLHAHVFRS
jgi:hypothetical protein